MIDKTDENWLRAAVVHCPSCNAKLFRVDHSPFYDCWLLYCDCCPTAVEISYYDSRIASLRSQLNEDFDGGKLLEGIEKGLNLCTCGGSFRVTSPRRCFQCATIVLNESGADLSPYTGCENEDRDPTAEEQARYEAFEERFVRKSNLWR